MYSKFYSKINFIKKLKLYIKLNIKLEIFFFQIYLIFFDLSFFFYQIFCFFNMIY